MEDLISYLDFLLLTKFTLNYKNNKFQLIYLLKTVKFIFKCGDLVAEVDSSV